MKLTIHRKLVLLFIAGLSFATTQAQVKFGIKAGANFSTFSGSDATGASSLIGFNGGVLVKIHLAGGWGIQPEALYSGQGAKYSSPGSATGTLNNAYINIPVLLTYKLPFGLSFQAGPQFGILMSAKASSGGVSVDEKSNYKSSDVSLDMGAAFMTHFSSVSTPVITWAWPISRIPAIPIIRASSRTAYSNWAYSIFLADYKKIRDIKSTAIRSSINNDLF